MEATIFNILASSENISRKKLRKKVIEKLSENADVSSGAVKSEFGTLIDTLLSNGSITENDDVLAIGNGKRKAADEIGNDQTTKKSRKMESDVTANTTDEKKKNKKSKSQKSDKSNEQKGPVLVDLWKNGEQYWREGTFDPEYLRTNPDRITRLFCGNLNLKVNEEELKKCINGVKYIMWVTDKSTGQFYGSSFLEMKDPDAAAVAVQQDKSKFMGRPLKIYYCPPRPGSKWPPRGNEGSSSAQSGGGRNSGGDEDGNTAGMMGGGGPPRREKTPKPPGCKKLYAANLSYNIDDETIMEFFKDCGTMVGLRWLTHRETGEFRGSGFVEFSCTEEAEKAFKLDGKELLGRPIRLDWTD